MTFVAALEVPAIQDPQLSPDGRQILFVLDQADWKNNRRVGHIYRINADGTGQMQLTFGERGESRLRGGRPTVAPSPSPLAGTATRTLRHGQGLLQAGP